MYARQVDQRSAIFQKALEVGEAYQLRTKVCVHICHCCAHFCFPVYYASSYTPLSSILYIQSCYLLSPKALLIRSLLQKYDIKVKVSLCMQSTYNGSSSCIYTVFCRTRRATRMETQHRQRLQSSEQDPDSDFHNRARV